jgi:hypothetical protein
MFLICSDPVPDEHDEAEPVKATPTRSKKSNQAKRKSTSTKSNKRSHITDDSKAGDSIAQLLAAGEQVLVMFFAVMLL